MSVGNGVVLVEHHQCVALPAVGGKLSLFHEVLIAVFSIQRDGLFGVVESAENTGLKIGFLVAAL